MHQHGQESDQECELFENTPDHKATAVDEKILIRGKPIAFLNNSLAQQAYKVRQKREKLFGSGLFSDPAWDILLDLYISEKVQKKVCITSACIAARVPASTGLRWISILVQNGHVERYDDPKDARRSFLALTAETRARLQALFEQPDESAH